MKINFVIPSTVLGGGVRMVFIYANYLVEQGHDVIVYVPKIFAWKDIRNNKINIKTSIANTFKRGKKVDWFDCKFPIRLAVSISDKYIRNADITVATAWYTARNVAELSPTKGEKVYFIQDYEVCSDGSDKDAVEATYKLPMNRISIAKWLDQIIYSISGYHTEIIYNGIADEEFLNTEKVAGTVKTIIMLGNMAPHKGTENGITILKKMQEKYGVRVIIFASTPSTEFPDTFEFYLRPDRAVLMDLYTQADICLFPSIREGWGLIVTEALAHKCAVVGNNTGSVAEIGIHGENMLIARDMNPESLETCLEQVLLDDALMRRLQENGYVTAKNLNSSKQCEKFESYLQSVIG